MKTAVLMALHGFALFLILGGGLRLIALGLFTSLIALDTQAYFSSITAAENFAKLEANLREYIAQRFDDHEMHTQ